MRDDARFAIDLDRLPVAAIATRDGVFVAVNRAYEELTGFAAADVLGKSMMELLARLVAPRDQAVLRKLAENRVSAEPRRSGMFWCSILTARGETRPTRVEWYLDANGHDALTLMLDAKPEAFGREVAEALARVAGSLSRCATEDEVLERAVDALVDHGFTATVLLLDGDEPLLRYGPSGTPTRGRGTVPAPRPPREVLARLNPGYGERRAAFFQDGMRLVREAYPEPVAERLLALLPAERMVQAPLYVGDDPLGALVVTGDALSPIVASALDLFAELVGKAVEAVRLRQERVDRERLAALGEAAAVMAHEVRNPVAAIKNALVLLDREPHASTAARTLHAIIGEETTRLAHLVDQLLDLGRPLEPRPCASTLEELVDRAARLLRTRGELADRILEMPRAGATPAWLDVALAELALVNVVRNALQSTSPSGVVRITTEASDTAARCIVEDEGPGIPADVVRRLGQPFVTTRATGTGMGLAVVRRILEASGGRMVVEAADRGARVVLEFPLPPSITASRGSSSRPPGATS